MSSLGGGDAGRPAEGVRSEPDPDPLVVFLRLGLGGLDVLRGRRWTRRRGREAQCLRHTEVGVEDHHFLLADRLDPVAVADRITDADHVHAVLAPEHGIAFAVAGDFADIGQGRRRWAGRRLWHLRGKERGRLRSPPYRRGGLAALEQAAAIALREGPSGPPPRART